MTFLEVGVGVVVLVGEVTALSTLHAREDPSELVGAAKYRKSTSSASVSTGITCAAVE
jgi:hypothetical protein